MQPEKYAGCLNKDHRRFNVLQSKFPAPSGVISSVFPQGDYVATVIAKKAMTKRSLEIIHKEEITVPPSVSRADKKGITKQSHERNS